MEVTAGLLKGGSYASPTHVRGSMRTIFPGIGPGEVPQTLPSLGCGITL
jgi:hypothetical protein